MLDHVINFKKLLSREIEIHNRFYRLYSVWTPVLLGTIYILLSTKEFIGKPIICSSSIKYTEIDREYWDAHCWGVGTYVLTNKQYGQISPGVAQLLDQSDTYAQDFYKYTWLIIATHIIIARFPYTLWGACEGGLLRSLCVELKSKWTEKDALKAQITRVVGYLIRNNQRDSWYLVQCLFFNALCVLSPILGIEFINFVMHNKYRRFGMALFDKETSIFIRDIDILFPLQAKCAGSVYGPSGSVVNYDHVCQLTINPLNRICFGALWFWNVAIFLSGLMFLSMEMYISLEKKHAIRSLIAHADENEDELTEKLMKCKKSTLFILRQIQRNVNIFVFEELMKDVVREIQIIKV